ncbi:hypothetical protein ACFQZQ_10185 [Lysobacter koreensis]|uniref:PKD domain-containing protein n=1 Tax=Lysobacter koreensis TaxID=266122 RepID=A0ABW2YP61_9GAMM
MTRTHLHTAVAAVLLASVALVGCKKKEEVAVVTPPPAATEPAPMPAPMPTTTAPVSVTMVDLGNAIGPDNKVTTMMTTFGTKDTIYTSVATDGTATNVPLTAKWTYQDGQTVGTETKTLNTTGPTVTEFHATKPSGWPTGKYTVEISLNGMLVQSKQFEVK